MKRFIIIFLFLPVFAFAQQTVIRELAGTVEIKFADSNVWQQARQGQILYGNTTISTGFRSTAIITMGSTLLTVRPLTRLTIAELIQIEGSERTELNIQSGRVRADVTPPPGGKVEFTVRSSSATTSVRGTSFEVDTHGVSVSEGVVLFQGYLDSPVLVDAGGFSRIDERTGRIIYPTTVVINDLVPDLPVATEIVQDILLPSAPVGPVSVPLRINVYGE